MRRRGLRPKRKGADPISKLYGREVRRRRYEGGYRAGQWDPHHPAGRAGKNKLFFVMVPRGLHDRIHADPKTARAEGWLAEINGTFRVSQPAVMRALERWQELLTELDQL